jgi:dTDP-4-dehydrorhamnose 3,5-epimerase
MNFTAHTFNIAGPLLIQMRRFNDDRGFFEESFRDIDMHSIGLPPFVQENHSFSMPPVIRGMHYQLNPKAQGKLIFCVSGKILDVIVDIRRKSDTYGQYERVLLSDISPSMLYVPPGFAHGFFAYDDPVHLIYKTTEYYDKDLDRAIRWDDPKLNINWGINFIAKGKEIQISDKDKNAPLLVDADNNF